MRIALLCSVLYLLPVLLLAQLNSANRFEYQIGNLPDTKPSGRTALFEQLDLQYQFYSLVAGARFEYFNPSTDGLYYAQFSQKFLQYNKSALYIRIGNFYESVGRGLTLRTYELPGITYEEPGSRQRYGFYKDMEGLSLRYSGQFIEFKSFYGNVLDLLQPPSRHRVLRRPNLVQGSELILNTGLPVNPGLYYLRSDRAGIVRQYTGSELFGSFPFGLFYYLEYSREHGNGNSLFQFGQKSAHAFYGSINQSIGFVNISAEYKDYHNFTLQINDPPSLVREHSQVLLNRSAHAVQPDDERGFQLEAQIGLGDNNTSTLNYTRARNITFTADYLFIEAYMDLKYYLTETTLILPFINWAKDELANVHDRFSAGIRLDNKIHRNINLSTDLEFQSFARRYFSNPSLNHQTRTAFADVSVSQTSQISAGLNIEVTDDLLETNRLFDRSKNKYKLWAGFHTTWKYTDAHLLSLFFGERRGGKACSGGICYEVQPFNGLELRVTSRL
jgi:hypothetical protein